MSKQIRVVAVIGAFSAYWPWQRWLNTRRAKAVARQVWELGAVPYLPHTMAGWLWGIIPEEVIGPGLLELCGRCDTGVLVEGWEHSERSLHERASLYAQGKPVFATVDELRAWLST